MKPLKINRTNDAVFKNIFANKKHKAITIDFINSVLEFKGTAQINDITFIDRELDGETVGEKETRLDLLGECVDGTKINIELQVASMAEMGKRSLFYWCRIYNDLETGEDYTELKRTVSINILDFNMFDKTKYPKFHSCFGIYDDETGNQLTTDFEMHFIELPKWKLSIMGDDNKPDTQKIKELKRLEKWVSYFSRKTSPEELEAIAMSEPMIEQALEAEVLFSQDKIAWWEYEKAEKERRDKIAIKNTARNERSEELALDMMADNEPVIKIIKYSKLAMDRLKELASKNGYTLVN